MLLAPYDCAIDTHHGDDDDKPDALERLRRWVHALRGVWVQVNEGSPPKHSTPSNRDNLEFVAVDFPRQGSIRIAVTNHMVTDAEWEQDAAKKSRPSPGRKAQLASIFNQIICLPKEQRPHYLVMPELAIPRKWARPFAQALASENVNLIAGVEYLHLPRDQVANEVFVSLKDSRLGYPTWAQFWHRKSAPAVEEGQELLNTHGKTFEGAPPSGSFHYERIYKHGPFAFSILICSELLNVTHQSRYRGWIDALIVPSWNKDLKTFSPAVESAAYATHSYLVYANNGEYGDARIRAPHKKDFMQDVCRVRGGKNVYIVVSELDVTSLRRFHSRHTPTTRDRTWKVVPDGFEIAPFRLTLPASPSGAGNDDD